MNETESPVCGHCGYLLQGLVGPTVRCPECGHGVDLGTGYIPPKWLRRARRRFWVAPNLLAALASALIVATGIFVVTGHFVFVVIALPPVFFLGAGLIVEVQDACRNQDGWRGALWLYIVTGATCGGGAMGTGLAAWLWLRPVSLRGVVSSGTVFLGAAAAVILPLLIWRWATRRLRARLDVLQSASVHALARQLYKIDEHRRQTSAT